MSCLICERIEMIKSSTNPHFVYEFETGYVVIGDYQHFYGYSLFLYKEHITELHFIPDRIKQKHMEELLIVYEAVFNAFKPEKMNCELLGNGDPHVHWHLFPRHSNDPIKNKPIWQLPNLREAMGSTKPDYVELEKMKEKLKYEIEKLVLAK